MVSSSSVILLVAMIFATVYVQADSSTAGTEATASPTTGGATGSKASHSSSGTGATSAMTSTSYQTTTTKFVHSQQTLPALAIGTIALCLML
ncbi:hypothetical protein WR25_26513 [Diploscapter pachys]|uniref:Uncharacterized protein n=1 Tax=Diploscapter pachys TaxID=2018661 RepID=A0A2A2LJ17_9BILA|nr:hypothetical protein WR25_26513 [Diploscapter pachys]